MEKIQFSSIGYDLKKGYGSVNVPIHQTTAYDFGSAEEAANRFSLKSLGQIYTRLTNPATDIFEAKNGSLRRRSVSYCGFKRTSCCFFAIYKLACAGEKYHNIK